MYHNVKMDMNKLRALGLAMVLAMAACAPGHYSAMTPSPESITVGKRLLKLHNEARRDGLPCGSSSDSAGALAWSDQLAGAAHRHSADMAKKEFLQHRGSDGSSSGKRVTDSGFAWAKYGENIAYGHRTSEVIVAKWLSQERHCHNIMDPDYTALGAAMVDGYWTVVLAKPKLPKTN